MKKFYTRLDVSKIGIRKWKLLSDWITPFGTVPKGDIFNGANVPRIFWILIRPEGELFEASIIHDHLYKYAIQSKKFADKSFYEAAIHYKCNSIKAKISYLMVRLFGRGNY